MPLSKWAVLFSMVAKVTGHNTEFIRRKMPLACCYQYRTIYYQLEGIKCVKPSGREKSGLQQII
jgi:hypothetical protein